MNIEELKAFIALPEHTGKTNPELLTAWQGVTKRETTFIKTPTMNGLLGQWKLKIPFKDIAKTVGHEFRDYADAFVDSTKQPTDFNFNSETTMGAANISMLEEMIAAPLIHSEVNLSTILSQFKDLLVYLGSNVTYPNAGAVIEDIEEAQDTGQIIPLNNNDTQHKVTFAIATQPRKPVRVIIEQQFGAEGDLTEWHEVGSVTVNYTQRHYESGYLPAKPKGATIRNLRAVSPLTIGLSKV